MNGILQNIIENENLKQSAIADRNGASIGDLLFGQEQQKDYSYLEEAFVKPAYTTMALGDVLVGDQENAKKRIKQARETETLSLTNERNPNFLADSLGMVAGGIATGGATSLAIGTAKRTMSTIAKRELEKTLLAKTGLKVGMDKAFKKSIGHITTASLLTAHQPEAWIKENGNIGFNRNTAKAIGMNIAIPVGIDTALFPIKTIFRSLAKSKMATKIQNANSVIVNHTQTMASALNKNKIDILHRGGKDKFRIINDGDKAGFISLDDFNEITPKISSIKEKLTIDEIANHNEIDNIAVVDKGGNFVIKSKLVGKLVGKIEDGGIAILDREKSSIYNPTLKVGKTPIFKPSETIKTVKENINREAQPYTEAYEYSDNSVGKRGNFSPTRLEHNKPSKSFLFKGENEELVHKTIKTFKTIFNKITGKETTNKTKVTENTQKILNGITDKVYGVFNDITKEVTNDNLSENSFFKTLYKQENKKEATTYSGLKKEAQQGIQYAVLSTFLKNAKLLGKKYFSKEDLTKLSSSIINDFKNIYGIKTDTIGEQFFKDIQKKLADSFSEDSTTLMFEKYKPEPTNNIKKKKVSANKAIQNLNNTVLENPTKLKFTLKKEIKDTLNNLKHIVAEELGKNPTNLTVDEIVRYSNRFIEKVKDKNQHVHISGESEAKFVAEKRYDNIALTKEEQKYLKHLLNTKFQINQLFGSKDKILDFLNKLKNKSDEELYLYFEKIQDPAEFMKDTNNLDFAGKGQIEYINSLRNHIDDIIDFVSENNVENGLQFDVAYDPNIRFRYEGSLSPHNSKLIQYLFPPKEATIDLTKSNNRIFAKRAILEKFEGHSSLENFKVSKATDEEIENTFSDFFGSSTKQKTIEPETFLQEIGLKEAKSFLKNPFQKSMPITIEIDGTANGLSMLKARLGLENADASIDPYSDFAKTLNTKTNLINFFGRKDVKTVITGLSYGQSVQNTVKTFVENFILKNLHNKDNRLLNFLNEFGKSHFAEKLISKETLNKIQKLTKEVEILQKEKLKFEEQISLKKNDIEQQDLIQKKLTKKSKELDTKLEALNKEKKIIDYHNFIVKIKKKLYNNITEEEFNSVVNVISNGSLKHNIIDTIKSDKAFKHINKLAEYTEAIKTKKYLHFLNEVTREKLDEAKVNSLIKLINSELKNKISDNDIRKMSKEIMHGVKKATDNKGSRGNFVTRLDVYNYLFKKGVLDTDALNLKHFSWVPTLTNGFGEKIKIVAIKGYAGFDRETGMRYPAFTEATLINPVLNISHDASIIKSLASSKGVLSKFDAVFGGEQTISLAKEMNQKFAWLLKNDNPYTNLLSDFEKTPTILNESNNVYKLLAIQRLVAKDKVPTTENIAKTIKQIKEQIGQEKFNIDDIKEQEKIVSSFKEKLKNDDTVNQYTLGSKDTEVKLSDIKDETFNKAFEPDFRQQNIYTPKEVDTNFIDETKQTIEWHDSLSKKGDIANADINANIVFKAEKAEAVVGKGVSTVYISAAPGSKGFWKQLFHEVMHPVFEYFDTALEPEAKSQISTFKNWINTLEVEKVGENGKPEKIIVGKMDVNSAKGQEGAVTILSQLYLKDLIAHNKDALLNNKTLTSDIVKELTDSYLVINETRMNSVRDLIDYAYNVNSNLGKVVEQQIATLTRTFRGVLKSNTDIIKMIEFNGKKEFSEFETTLNSHPKLKTAKDILAGRLKAHELNLNISSMSWFEAFTFNPQKEALEKALALQQGLENRLHKETTLYYENITKELKAIDPTGKIDRTYGNAITLGLHKLFKGEDLSEITLEQAKEIIIQKRDSILFELKRNIKDEALYKKVVNKIEDLAKGNIRKTKWDVARSLYNMLKHKQGFKDYTARQFIDIIEQLSGSYRLINKGYLETSLQKFFTNDKYKAHFKEFAQKFEKFENPYTLFGENINLDMSQFSYKAVASSTPIDGEIGSAFYDGKRYSIVKKSRLNHIVGSQKSQEIELVPTNFEKGLYKVKFNNGKDKGSIFLNAQNANIKHSVIDNDFSKMTMRNFYLTQKSDYLNDYNAQQFYILKKAGVYYYEQEFKQLSPEQQENFEPDISSPMAKARGKLYVNKKYIHYLYGSKGVNLAKAYGHLIADKKLANALATGTKAIFDLIKILRGTTLVYHAKTYINSFVSSMNLLALHGGLTKLRQAKALTKAYGEAINKYTKELASSNISRDVAKANFMKELERQKLIDIHHAFTEGGLANTIRSEVYKLGTFEENIIYQLLNKAGGENFAKYGKIIGADQSTKFGASIGSIFDATEMYPKVALFLHKIEEYGGNREKAIQSVLMAFPTYNNLPPILNFIDQFSPYKKYMYNIPKMALYGLDQSPKKTMAMMAMFFALPTLSFIVGEDGISNTTINKETDMNMVLIPNTYKAFYLGSMNPIDFDAITGNAFNFNFLSSSLSHFIDLTLWHEVPHKAQ